MPANTSPIFPLTPNIGSPFNTILTANTAVDGTGTVATCYTAGTNGGFIDSVEFRHLGTNVATVARIFVNNGSTNATATNNQLIGEVTVGANTLSQTAASIPYTIQLKKNVPSGYKINITIGTTVATGILPIVYAMDY